MAASAGRRVARGLILLLLALGGLWTAAWFTLRIVADGRISDRLALEASRGRKIACVDRSIEGFPFAFRVVCARFRIETVAPLRPLTIAGERLSLGVSLAAPMTFVATPAAPVEIRPGDAEPFTLSWREAVLKVDFDLDAMRQARLDIASPRISAPGQPFDDAAADAIVLTAKRSIVRPETDAALDGSLRVIRLAAPMFDRVSRNDLPADMSLEVTLTESRGLIGLPPPLALDRWRRAGGQLDIAAFALTKGDIQLDARGNLAIDPERRLRGRIAGGGKGVALGQNAPATRLGEAIARLGAAAANVRVPFAFVMENGQLKVGPAKIADLPPLY